MIILCEFTKLVLYTKQYNARLHRVEVVLVVALIIAIILQLMFEIKSSS